MAFTSIVLLLLASIPITFISANVIQHSPKYVTYPERMKVLNNFSSLAPSPEAAAEPIGSPSISHSVPTKTPASPTSTDVSNNVVDVRSNGAAGDGNTDDSKAFKAAWDLACNNTSQAKILVPKGYSFLLQPVVFSGPCQNSVIFQVDGTIVAQPDPKSWQNQHDSWIEFNRVDGLTLQGAGIIDGKGEKWWSCESCPRPVALRFRTCKNLTVSGYKGSRLSIKNSPQFHVVIDQECQNVKVDSISIISPGTSPNTDGIHLASKDILVRNSYISNGDDCVSLVDGSENIHIENIDCRDGHGISIGSLGKNNSKETVKNVTVTNCLISNSQNGVRIKTWASGSGLVSNVTFANIQMNAVWSPIIIDQFYCPDYNCSKEYTSSELLISDVTYTNITGTYNTENPAVYLKCSDKMPCVNITIADVQLSSAKDNKIPTSICANASGCLGENIQPPVTCLGKGSSEFLKNLSNKGVNCTNT